MDKKDVVIAGFVMVTTALVWELRNLRLDFKKSLEINDGLVELVETAEQLLVDDVFEGIIENLDG